MTRTGTPLSVNLAQTVEKDAHGNVQLSGTGALADLLCEEIKSKLGIKRCAAIRSAISSAPSPAAPRTWIGGRRAKSANSPSSRRSRGAGDGSVAIRRLGDYSSDYALVKLAKVAGKTKVMADAFIAPSGSDVPPPSKSICGRCWVATCRSPPACAAAPSPRC